MSAIPFAFFDSVKDGRINEGGMWACSNLLECNLVSHQRIDSDSGDFIGTTGTAIAHLSVGLSGTQFVPFVWSYQACYGTDAETKVMLWTLGSITQNDIGTPCPTLTSYTKTGVTSITNGSFTLKFDDAYDGKDFIPLRLFIGHMDLQLTLPTSSQVTATTSSSSTISSSESPAPLLNQVSSPSTGSATSSITETGNLTSIRIPNVSRTENPAETTVLGPSVANTPSSTFNSNNTVMIAGIAAGLGAASLLFLLLAFLFFRRRRRLRQEIKQEARINAERISRWIPRNAYPARVSELGMSSTSATFTSRTPSTVMTPPPPSYGMHPYHQIVTPRVMIEESESSSMDDMSSIDELRVGRASSGCHSN
ncbi:hypothetical protein M408DRAFT_22304 [Serendipita vermifera MAFF 305830]|uniref:Uncharacterized protein n=1 Tax=Serendipita vermifera MAFF 305830 TaxID=933852 RepID=A0A0C3B0L7_SERVB|nr:hypothetical protein M408DRAFT_22304 [Serendipita vermifera MAFF 305830]